MSLPVSFATFFATQIFYNDIVVKLGGPCNMFAHEKFKKEYIE